MLISFSRSIFVARLVDSPSVTSVSPPAISVGEPQGRVWYFIVQEYSRDSGMINEY